MKEKNYEDIYLTSIKKKAKRVQNELSETKVDDPDLQRKVDEFARLKTQIQDMNEQIKDLKEKLSTISDEVEPVLEQMDDQLLQTDEYIVQITRKGYERSSTSWKKSFEESLTKVNSQTRQVLMDVKESFTHTYEVSPSIDAVAKEERESNQNILAEGIFGSVADFFTDLARKVKKWWDSVRGVREANDELRDILQKRE